MRTSPRLSPPEIQDEYLFYDDIHPTTAMHRQIANYISHHLNLGSAAQDLFLVTDAALFFDDRFGFGAPILETGESNLQVTTIHGENESGPRRRQTSGIRADLDHRLNENFTLGGEFIYADGQSRSSDFESYGIGIDLIHRGPWKEFAYEIGLGGGYLWGDLTRDYDPGSFSSESDQMASTVSIHGALRDPALNVGGLKGYWEIELKHRFVFRGHSTESGASSLDLEYHSETLSTTVANLEIGLHPCPNLDLAVSLNPVLFHDGGEISSRQESGLAEFNTPDGSGYDVHTGRVSLIYRPSDSASIAADLVVGSEDTWSGQLSLGLRF